MTCTIEGCTRPVHARGWCSVHYKRWAAHGDPLVTLNDRGAPFLDRFMKRIVVAEGGCWEWTGAIDRDGYGDFHAPTRSHRAHRWSYEHHVGPIPEGLTIDHTCHSRATCAGGPSCRHRRCVNPEHLEPVTAEENSARMARTKTTCLRGHPLPPYVLGGQRNCPVCERFRRRTGAARRGPYKAR